MRFSWGFLQNMLGNGHSNLQTKLWVHITSNIFKISNSKITGSHQPPPYLPTLKAYPTPGVGGRFGIFSLKWRERMNLKVPGATLPLGCAILSTRARTVRGLVQPPLRRTRVKLWKSEDFKNHCLNFVQLDSYVFFYFKSNSYVLYYLSDEKVTISKTILEILLKSNSYVFYYFEWNSYVSY